MAVFNAQLQGKRLRFLASYRLGSQRNIAGLLYDEFYEFRAPTHALKNTDGDCPTSIYLTHPPGDMFL